jgi:hypothetical protein
METKLADSLHVKPETVHWHGEARRHLLSTLGPYPEAAGATALIVVELADRTTAEITLDQAAPDDAADSANPSAEPFRHPAGVFVTSRPTGW